jgi:hypothetical protein
MVEEPVHLSDWIQYLCHMVNTGYAIVLGSLAVIVTISMATYNFKPEERWIFFIPLMLGEISIILFLFGRKSRFKRAQLFLKAIMKEEKNDPKKIKEEWFDEGLNMIKIKKIYCSWGNWFSYSGAIIIFLSFGAVMFAIFWRREFTLEIISPMAIPISLGLSFIAIGISIESDNKMTSIANVQFLHVANMVEDARAYFIAGIFNPETYTWKTKNSIEMAIELLKIDEKKKYIKPEYQDKLFHYFNMSFNHFFKYPKWQDEKISMEHLISSYAMLEEFYNPLRKKEFNDSLDEYLHEGKKDFLTKVAKTKQDKAKQDLHL